MKLEVYSSDEWKQYAQDAHLVCFDEVRPADMNRIDFALLVVEDGKPVAYGTYREVDSETVYMQYGGSFPGARNSIKSFKAYCMCLRFLKEKYKRCTTLIENTNLVMMKFAMKCDLRVIGVRNYKGAILLEHFVEWTQ